MHTATKIASNSFFKTRSSVVRGAARSAVALTSGIVEDELRQAAQLLYGSPKRDTLVDEDCKYDEDADIKTRVNSILRDKYSSIDEANFNSALLKKESRLFEAGIKLAADAKVQRAVLDVVRQS